MKLEESFTRFSEMIIAFLPKLGSALLILALFWLGAKILTRVVERFTFTIDLERRQVIGLLLRIGRVTILTIGVVSALGTLGINVSAMVAGLGLTGFALGFALKDALSNFLAGLLILIYRPFRHQDIISVTGFEGKVIDINLRYTVLHGDGKKVFIPNSMLFTNTIALIEPAAPSETHMIVTNTRFPET